MSAEHVYGWAGKILHVNLESGHTSTEPTLKYAKEFLGERGINWAILYDQIKPGTGALNPENVLGIGTGVLVGTLVPGACRSSVDSKNPLTGGVGSADFGGHWGPELKFAGYDNIIIRGRSKEPTYLWIDDDHVELQSAARIMGKTTWETSELIREALGDPAIQVLCIGPAGENICLGACVIGNNARAAGRCGLGAVWGSKNLKAIAVRGTGFIEVANPDELIDIVNRYYEQILVRYDTRQFLRIGLGAYEMTTRAAEPESFVPRPFRNSQDVWEEGYWERFAWKALKKYEVRKLACFSCPVHGWHWYEVKEGQFAGVKGEGFPYNTIINWGSRLGIEYLPATIKLHVMCNQLGFDMDIPSVTIAWAMECYQRGILTKEDTDGLDLTWGNYNAIIELLQRMAHRKGKFADTLAEGVKRASEKIGRGSGKYALHVKGQDLYEEVRNCVGWAVGMATATRGGTHTRGIAPGYNAPIEEATRYTDMGKLVARGEQAKAIIDGLGLCYQGPNLFDLKVREGVNLGAVSLLAELVTVATGWKVSSKNLLTIGERIQNLEKAFNTREAGFTRKDDTLPERFFNEPCPSGYLKGFRLERTKFEKALDQYYRDHNWDVETGLQTRDTLEKLGLEKVAEELERMGKLPK